MQSDDWNRLHLEDSPDTGTEGCFLEVARELSPGRALDLGCGAGTLALALAENGWLVTGVDFAEAACARAQAAATERNINATFVVADVSTWTPAEPYDLVVSAYAMPPKGEFRDRAFGAAVRALRPGGTLVVAEWDRSMGAEWSMDPDEFVSTDEVISGLNGLDIRRADVMDVEAHGHSARSVFVQASRPS